MRELGILVAALMMFVALSLASSKFLTTSNVLNVARQISLLAIVACGMTYLFIAGELVLNTAYFEWLRTKRPICRECLQSCIDDSLSARMRRQTW